MNKKSILLGLVIAACGLPSFAKLECVNGVVVKKDGQALTAEQVTTKKKKISEQLAKMDQNKAKVAKDPEKRTKRKNKLSKKLEVLNSCKSN